MRGWGGGHGGGRHERGCERREGTRVCFAWRVRVQRWCAPLVSCLCVFTGMKEISQNPLLPRLSLHSTCVRGQTTTLPPPKKIKKHAYPPTPQSFTPCSLACVIEALMLCVLTHARRRAPAHNQPPHTPLSSIPSHPVSPSFSTPLTRRPRSGPWPPPRPAPPRWRPRLWRRQPRPRPRW